MQNERPLWKRVGVHQPIHRSEASSCCKSQKELQQSQPHPFITRHSHQHSLSGTKLNFGSEIPECQQELSNQLVGASHEERIFQQCFNKFQKVHEEERQSTEHLSSREIGLCTTSPGKNRFSSEVIPMTEDLASLQRRDAETSQLKQQTYHTAKHKHKIVKVLESVRDVKDELESVRELLGADKATLLRNISCIGTLLTTLAKDKTRVATDDRTTQTDSNNFILSVKDEHDISREHIECMYSTRPSENLNARHDLSRSSVKSETQVSALALMEVLELRQKIELLSLSNQLLKEEAANFRSSQKNRERNSTNHHLKRLEELYERNTEQLKLTINEHAQELFGRDQQIAALKDEINQQKEQLMVLHQKSKAACLNSPTANDVYVKKYRGLYEHAEQERLKLAESLESSLSKIADLKCELENFQRQSSELVDENAELQNRLDDLNTKRMQQAAEYRSMSKLLQSKRSDNEEILLSLREQLEQRDLKIEFLERRLEEALLRCKTEPTDRSTERKIEKSPMLISVRRSCNDPNDTQSIGSISNLRQIVEHDKYFKNPLQSSAKPLQSNRKRQDTQSSQRHETRRQHGRLTTTQIPRNSEPSELSLRLESLSAMMRREIQTSFHRS